jgi:hypothetical protein
MTVLALVEERKFNIKKITKNKRGKPYEQQQRTKIGGENCGSHRRKLTSGQNCLTHGS